MTDVLRELRAELRAIGKRAVSGYSAESLEPLVLALERDWAALSLATPPVRARMLRRMELQIRALPELARLQFVNTTREGFLDAVFALIRFAVKVL